MSHAVNGDTFKSVDPLVSGFNYSLYVIDAKDHLTGNDTDNKQQPRNVRIHGEPCEQLFLTCYLRSFLN